MSARARTDESVVTLAATPAPNHSKMASTAKKSAMSSLSRKFFAVSRAPDGAACTYKQLQIRHATVSLPLRKPTPAFHCICIHQHQSLASTLLPRLFQGLEGLRRDRCALLVALQVALHELLLPEQAWDRGTLLSGSTSGWQLCTQAAVGLLTRVRLPRIARRGMRCVPGPATRASCQKVRRNEKSARCELHTLVEQRRAASLCAQ